MATEAGEDLITQAEAARLRGVTRSAIAYLIAQGRLQTYERFGVTFVSKSEVESYEPRKPGPTPKSSATQKRATGQKRASRGHSTGAKKGGKR